MAGASAEDFKKLGAWLTEALSKYNYQVSEGAAAGKVGKNIKSMREYRLQLINKQSDTSDKLIAALPTILKSLGKDSSNISYNKVSPNSSKFPSYTFKYLGHDIDLVIGRGANKGENFETQTVADLAGAFSVTARDPQFAKLIQQMNDENRDFASVEIQSVKQRTGSTKKEGIAIEKLGAIIGDIVLKDNSGKEWFISLKDTNGATFSSYSGAASLFNAAGDIQPKSPGADFLNAFGVDLNKVQEGFDLRNRKKSIRKRVPIEKENAQAIKSIFERAWGMNYFYVRKLAVGWKVFWLDRTKLNKLAGNIKVKEIRYPNINSKQITIICGNTYQEYTIELRNSKAGEYPNDTKFKVK